MQKSFLLGFALIILVQAPFIFAVDCRNVDSVNYQTCVEIKNSRLTDQEKEILISNLDYSGKFFPDHEYISLINKNIKVTKPPKDVKTHDGKYIKNTWADILIVMPSVLHNGILYVPSETEVLAGFNYDLIIPKNYYSSGYPRTSGGDCKTKYYLHRNEAENKVYANGIYQGNGKFVKVKINSDSRIEIKYLVDVTVKIKHYEWDKYCSSRRSDGSCRRYSKRCEYDYTEYKKDKIVIKDFVDVKLYKNNLTAKVQKIDNYGSSTKIQIDYSNSVDVNFKDSSFKTDEFVYSINYSKAPYYFYTLKAEDYRQTKINNLFLDGEFVLVKDPSDCKIKAFDFFNVFEKPCDFNKTSEKFHIKTSKLRYKPDEILKVNVYPKNIPVLVTYGDETKQIVESTTFEVQPLQNKVTAEYGNYKSEKIIYVGDNKLKTVWNFSIFGFLNYFIYIFIRTHWGAFI